MTCPCQKPKVELCACRPLEAKRATADLVSVQVHLHRITIGYQGGKPHTLRGRCPHCHQLLTVPLTDLLTALL